VAKLTEVQRRNVALLTDHWQSVYEIAANHPSGASGVSGIANAFGRLAKAGLAEWCVISELSSYRITDLGRQALTGNGRGE
jgi:hypothetical protein